MGNETPDTTPVNVTVDMGTEGDEKITEESTTPKAPSSETPAQEEMSEVELDVSKNTETKEENEEETNWPEWVPQWAKDKYKTPEDFAKGINELNTSHTQNAQELARLKKEGPKSEDKTKKSSEGKEETNPTELIQNLSKSYQETGQLTKEDKEQLVKAGIPENYIEQFLQGTEALVNQQRAAIFKVTGGEESYAEMMKWAGETLSDLEKTAYNKIVTSSDAEAATFAVQGLFSRYAQETGKAQNNDQSNVETRRMMGFQHKGVAPFKSESDLVKAMSDSRYETDPDYRAQVQARVAKSNL